MLKVILASFACLAFCPTFAPAVERFEIRSDLDTAYMPYRLGPNKCADYKPYDSAPLYAIVSPYVASYGDGQVGSLLRVSNNTSFTTGRPRLTQIAYPAWTALNENPVGVTLTDWQLYSDPSDSSKIIAGTGYIEDSVYLVRKSPETGIYDEVFLGDYHRQSGAGTDGSPSIELLMIEDYDLDGDMEAVLRTAGLIHNRTLFCVNLGTMQKEWALPLSSIPSYSRVYDRKDSLNPGLIFTTYNSKNGCEDSLFSDQFSYLVAVDSDGEVITRKILAYQYANMVDLCPSWVSGQFFVSHALNFVDPDDFDGLKSDTYRISVIDGTGNPLRTIETRDRPYRTWSLPFGPEQQQRLFVRFWSGFYRVYDAELKLIAETEHEDIGAYRGMTRIHGTSDPVYIFETGVYDSDFDIILRFPFPATSVEPIAYGKDSSVTDIAINAWNQVYVGKIHGRNTLERASIFYHNNQTYVLMCLSGLLVGLVLTNVFRRRTKRNLEIISTQKQELEETHQKLKDTQAKLVAAEKYEQAKDIAGGFAHEIRNALFPADGLLTKLSSTSNLSQLGEERLRRLHTETHKAIGKAIDITELISQYTKLGSEYKPGEVDLSIVINEVIEANRMQIEDCGVEISRPPVEHISVIANHAQAYMVFNNLLLNSLDALAGRDNPRVDIAAEVNQSWVRTTFRDNGCGISSDEIESVFNTFFSTKPDKGTGLGLATTKKIVEMYGGTITVTSKENEGTIFETIWKAQT